jgi:hypothetical protein
MIRYSNDNIQIQIHTTADNLGLEIPGKLKAQINGLPSYSAIEHIQSKYTFIKFNKNMFK